MDQFLGGDGIEGGAIDFIKGGGGVVFGKFEKLFVGKLRGSAHHAVGIKEPSRPPYKEDRSSFGIRRKETVEKRVVTRDGYLWGKDFPTIQIPKVDHPFHGGTPGDVHARWAHFGQINALHGLNGAAGHRGGGLPACFTVKDP